MKTIIMGEVRKNRYYVDFELARENYEDILENAEDYLVEDNSYVVEYVELDLNNLNDTEKYQIHKSEFDAARKVIVHYTRKVVKNVEPDENDKLKAIERAKRICSDVLESRKQIEEYERKNRFKFWK